MHAKATRRRAPADGRTRAHRMRRRSAVPTPSSVMAPDPHPPSAELAYRGVADILGGFADGSLTVARWSTPFSSGSGPSTHRAASGSAPSSRSRRRPRGGRRLDAERAAGTVRGPLHGVPVLVKDNIEAVGLPGTAGSLALAGRRSTDAPLVTRLRDAGLVVLGSTNLSEWANLRSAHSASGWSAYGGLTGNPWALDRSAGGSSSGSGAAVAAGLTPLAIGTETDGSIVCPASLNGWSASSPRWASCRPSASSRSGPARTRRADGAQRRDGALLLDALAGPTSRGRTGHCPRLRPDAATWRTDHPATDASRRGGGRALARRRHAGGDPRRWQPGPEV